MKAIQITEEHKMALVEIDNVKELKPGDWVGKSGHIATYVGANLAVEFVGGAYGCQLTDIDDRIVYNYMENKLQNMSSWTKYRRPKAY